MSEATTPSGGLLTGTARDSVGSPRTSSTPSIPAEHGLQTCDPLDAAIRSQWGVAAVTPSTLLHAHSFGMLMITTALLDLDGTLVDSNDQHAKAWVEVLGEFGHTVRYKEARAAIGKGADHFLPDVVGVKPESREGRRIMERRAQLFRERYLHGLRPFPHARDLLERMHAGGLRLVVATSAQEGEMRVILEILGARELVDNEATASDARRSKPDGDIVAAALKKAGCTTGEALLLGDTPYDIEAAARSNVGAVALRCGGWNDHALRGALAIYDNPTMLLAELDASPFFAGVGRT